LTDACSVSLCLSVHHVFSSNADAVIMHSPCGAFWNSATRPSFSPFVCLSVPSRSCLGYRHAGCLQLSHRRPLEMCGLWTRPRTDVNPPRFLDPWSDADNLIGDETICHRGQRAFWPFCPSSDHGCRNGCLTCNLTKRNFMFTLYQLS